MTIREYRESDREHVKEITVICFDGVSIDQNMEKLFGQIAGKDWKWRKARQVGDDIAANPAGTFVAETADRPVGYVTTRVDHATNVGSILHIAVLPSHRNGGLGRKLMDRAITYLGSEGMEYVRIETLEQNAVGRQFYPSYGFKEVAGQIHYIKRI